MPDEAGDLPLPPSPGEAKPSGVQIREAVLSLKEQFTSKNADLIETVATIRAPFEEKSQEEIENQLGFEEDNQEITDEEIIAALLNEAVAIGKIREGKATKAKSRTAGLKELWGQNNLWEARKKIVEETLSDQELQQVMELNDLLKKEPEKLRLITETLINFQEKILEGIGVKKELVQEATAHVRETIILAQDAPDGGPLVELILAAHDMAKYNAICLMGEHELLGAILGPEVIGATLDLLGLGRYKNGVCKLAEKAIYCHGEYEWPERQASPFRLGKSVIIHAFRVDSHFLGLFFKAPRSDEVVIVKVEDEQTPENQEAIGLCRKIIRGVSEADKIAGMTLEAFAKYAQEARLGSFFSQASSWEYLLTFSDTFYQQTPEAIGLKATHGKAIQTRGELFFALLDDAQHRPKDALKTYQQAFGKEGEKIFAMAKAMVTTFSKGKAAYALGQRSKAMEFKQHYSNFFRHLSGELKAIRLPYPPPIEEKCQKTSAKLHQHLRESGQFPSTS